MCTRYFMDDAPKELAEIYATFPYNPIAYKFIKYFAKPIITKGEVRPTDTAPVIAPNKKGIRSVYPMRWGFKNPNHNSTVFNARIETAGAKPTFKAAWESHRCIIPASYYFEWEHFKSTNGKVKTGAKYAIQPKGATMTWLCGLYRIENGFPVFVVLTREPSESVCFIHDRMPLILPQDKINDWINPETNPTTMLKYALDDMIVEKVVEDNDQTPHQLTFNV